MELAAMDDMDLCKFPQPVEDLGNQGQLGQDGPLKAPVPSPPAWAGRPDENGPSLEQLLRREMVHLPQQGTKFLPIDKLNEIVSPDAVRHELQSRFHIPDTDRSGLNKLVSEVCGSDATSVSPEGSHRDSGHPNDLKSRRRLFAILTLIDQIHQILPIIWENLWDSDLPFTLQRTSSDSKPTTVIRTRDNIEVRCLRVWANFAKEAFDVYQWTVLSPFFHFPGSSQGEAPHYELPDRAVVPFISAISTSQGGYSTVYKTVVHPAHYSIGGVSQPVSEAADTRRSVGTPLLTWTGAQERNHVFAIKKLHDPSEALFKHEVEALRRVRQLGRANKHLVELLATYTHQGSCYMVFPWAEGNLNDFWRMHPTPNKSIMPWAMDQFLGITQGLARIHRMRPPRSAVSSPDYGCYGRHGDLKPGNILWYKSEEAGHGRLVIADFGLSRFHTESTRSRSNAAMIPVSPTYRPPECELGETVTSSYDIWMLGCIFFEFATWLLLGYSGVEEFARRRLTVHDVPYQCFKEDTFFKMGVNDNGNRFASVNPAVREVWHTNPFPRNVVPAANYQMPDSSGSITSASSPAARVSFRTSST